MYYVSGWTLLAHRRDSAGIRGNGGSGWARAVVEVASGGMHSHPDPAQLKAVISV
jgi:hypothetical protein